jgi:hypothetical protein
VTATLCFVSSFVLVNLLMPGPGPGAWLAILVYFLVLAVGGMWTGTIARTRKAGFVTGFLCGWAGLLLGLLILLPIEAFLQSGSFFAASIAIVAAALVGIFLGFITGAVGGFAGYVGMRWIARPG